MPSKDVPSGGDGSKEAGNSRDTTNRPSGERRRPTWVRPLTDASAPQTREALILKAWTNAVKRWTQDGIVTQEGVVPPSSSAANADKQLKNGDVTAAGESPSNPQWRELRDFKLINHPRIPTDQSAQVGQLKFGESLNDKYPVVQGLTDGIQAYPIIHIEITSDGLKFAADRLVESYALC